MASHSVTCHPAEVKFPALTPAEADTRFSDPEVRHASSGAARGGEGGSFPLWVYEKIGRQLIC